MRKVIVSMMVSVDGFIEGRDPQEYWHNWNDEMSAYMMDFFKRVDLFIYGRKAYEEMIAYWPQLTDEFAMVMNSTPKLVFSKSLASASWNSTLLREVDPDYINNLKQDTGKDIVIFAGSGMVESFMRHNLVDEFRLIINPLLLGGGKSFFNNILKAMPLKFISAQTFACGNVLLIYETIRRI